MIIKKKINCITIGRDEKNIIQIYDPFVSKWHCKLVRDYDGISVAIIDNNSKNGTFVNGIRIDERQGLRYGDIVKIGNTVLQWEKYADNLHSILDVDDDDYRPPGSEDEDEDKDNETIGWRIITLLICAAILLSLGIGYLLLFCNNTYFRAGLILIILYIIVIIKLKFR